MATSTSTKQRAQGGGRKANSEPRIQVFKEFNGCNFQLSPHDFTLGKEDYEEQSDLQMNYVVVQNNASVTTNKTIETRNNIVKLFSAPAGKKFTDACMLYGNQFFIALNDDTVKLGVLGVDHLDNVTINDITGDDVDHTWKSFSYIDDQLIGCTEEGMLWTGPLVNPSLTNAKEVPDPPTMVMSSLVPKGTLSIVDAQSQDADHPYRIAISCAFVNKFGPTIHSPELEFYANYPVDEWHGGRYLEIDAAAPTGYNIQAVEFYYTTGNASTLLFAGRYDFAGGDGGSFAFEWFGYLDATTMWPIANLIAPTENYTQGAPASHVTCIDSRVYFWGDPNQPQRLYIGGNSGNLFSVSPGTCGGFVDVEPGTGQEIRCVMKYKTQGGASIVTMLCDAENTQKEQRYNLVENTVSLSNDQSMKSWQAEQVAGAVGCKSYNGAVVCEDGLYSVSRYGLALTTMTMEYNSQIRTNYVSDPIKPAFTDRNRDHLSNASIIECDGVIYLAFGKENSGIENTLFCYDIDLKAWWTIRIATEKPILNLIHIDYEGHREGIGIITEDTVYMLPLTINDDADDEADFNTLIQTGELSITQPQQNWFYLSQLEFRFDYFYGSVKVELTGIDQFGRKVNTVKNFTHNEPVFNWAEFMRVDLRLRSYQIRITGQARFRMTHFMAKVYTMSSKVGLVWGFDDSQSFRTSGDIHPTFKDYNDIVQAIIP